MREFKKLFQAKRILALVLALAMTVTMLPLTAYAAPAEGSETITDSEPADDTVTDVQTADDADDQTSDDDAAAEDAASDDASENDSADAEDAAAIGDDASEDEPADAEGADADGADITVNAEGDETTENETSVYEIVDNSSSSDKTAEYNGDSQSFSSALEKIDIKKDGTKIGTLNTYSELTNWVKKGETTPLGSEPTEVGSYQLCVKIPKDYDGKNDEKEATFDFEITKQVLSVSVDTVYAAPGTKAADISYYAGVYSTGTDSFSASYDKADPDANKESKLLVTATVKDAITNKELGNDDKLVKNGDYAVTLHFAFTDKATAEDKQKFEMPEDQVVDVNMTDLVSTHIEWNYTDKYISEHQIPAVDEEGKPVLGEDGKPVYTIQPFTYTYTGKVQAPVEGTDYEVHIYSSEVVETKEDGTIIYKELEGKIEQVWYDDNYNELDQVPVNKGEYSFRLYYEGEEGLYAESYSNYGSNNYGYNNIPVTIDAVLLEVVPVLDNGKEFKAGTTAGEVLAQVGYEVYKYDETAVATDGLGERFDNTDKFDRDRFWGTSYYNTGRTQPYQPIFYVLEEIKTPSDENGNDVTEPDYNLLENGDKLEAGKTYIVEFSGLKGVYLANGSLSDYKRINDYDSVNLSNPDSRNYKVDEEYVYDYALEISVAATTVIDVDAITLNENNTKAYDGKPLFATKAAYKKAVVKVGEKTVAKDTDDSLTYTWYKSTGSYQQPVVGEDGKPVLDADGNQTYETVPSWSAYGSTNIPEDAGIYKLEVSYYDKTHANDSAKAEVIFEITKRVIKVVPSGDYEVYTGVTVGQFLDMTDIDYSIVPVEGVEIAELSNWEINDEYYLTWDVEKKDAETGEWNSLSPTYVFAEEDKDNVRLAVENFYIYSPDSNNYTDREEKETTAEDGTTSTKYEKYHETLPVTVNTMGAAELTVTTDLSKLEGKSKVYDGVEFDISDALKNGLIKITTGTTDVTEDALSKMEGFWRSDYDDYAKPIDAGIYTYYLVFGGNEDYKAFAEYDYYHENFVYETDITYEITKAELTVIPSIKEVVEAGGYGYSAYDQYATVFETPVEKDKEAFTYQNSYDKYDDKYNYWPAIDGNITFNVFDTEGNNVRNQKLKGLETYTVVYGYAELSYPYNMNYTLKAGEPVSFTTVRAKSKVAGFNLDEESNVILKLNDVIVPTEENGYTHTVTAVNAIPYVYDDLTDRDGEDHKPGNYIGVRITMPAEYNRLSQINPMYENSIKNAGGFVYATGTNFIEVGFDAKEDTKKEFDIRWVEGYVEHFILDFTNADFAADLTETAAPKSIAFNNAAKKMVVGTDQQLDVKLTKSQLSDTIHLSYKVDKEDILCVTDDGEVTALKPGTATVIVYSSKLSIDENGKRTWVDTTPAKQAKVTINVKDVTAPKIKSVTPLDNRITVSWAAPIDGYRSEIYVLPGKNVKANVFEEKIASMNNEAWQGIFAIAPVYVSPSSYSSITKLYSTTLSGLSSQEAYTVYVRNVSAIRNLYCGHGDGCQVSESHAGAVKSVTTTKSQVVRLRFDKEKIEDSYYSADDYYYTTTYTTVALSKGSLNLPLEGLFRTKAEDNTADAVDTTWKKLPLNKDEQKDYAAPKLVYSVGEVRSYANGSGYMGQSYGYVDEYGDWSVAYLYNTPLATIKNGKLTLKGVGTVAVVARDVNTSEHAVIFVTITADADGIKGKTVKMQVGQTLSLYDMVTYSEGKKTLIGSYYDRGIIVDDALRETFANDDRFELIFNNNDDIRVKAVQAGGKALSFKVSDRVVNANKGATVEATVKLSVTGLEPVKNLKTSFVTDQFADLEFSHPGNADAFRIQVTDARGNILQSKYVQNNGSGYSYYYNASTKANVYTYRISKLTQKSKYNVTVTALYGDTASKVAKKSFTTTLLPASYERLDSNIKNSSTFTGGVRIVLPNRGSAVYLNNQTLLSGNTYTLAINENDSSFNKGAKYAKTDTLTWTSTNKKVATVKANAGSYTATLKAVGVGSTYIEVKSKITKAVIARWRVNVEAVGSAYVIGNNPSDNYYGDNEQLGKNEVDGSAGGTGNSGSQGGIGGTESGIRPAGTTKILNLGNNQDSASTYVSVQENEFQWVRFTAPEAGDYWFYSESLNGDPKAWFFTVNGKEHVENHLDEYSNNVSLNNWSLDSDYGHGYDDDATSGIANPYGSNNFSKIINLEKNQTICIAVGYYDLSSALNANIYVEKVTEPEPLPTKPLTLGEPTDVSVVANQYQWVEFTADEDGYYRFYSENTDGEDDPYAWFLNQQGKEEVGDNADASELSSCSNNEEYGYGSNDDGNGGPNFSKIVKLAAGDTIYVAVGSNGLGSSLSTQVNVEKMEQQVPTEIKVSTDDAGENISLSSGYKWLKFSASNTGTFKFDMQSTRANGRIWFFTEKGYQETGDWATVDTLDGNSQRDVYGYLNGVTGSSTTRLLYLEKDTDVYLAVGSSTSGSSDITVKVLDTLQELEVDQEANVTVTANVPQIFAFTAPESTTYTFTFDPESSDWTKTIFSDANLTELLKNESDSEDADETGEQYYIEKDSTVYWKVEYTGNNDSADITVKVEPDRQVWDTGNTSGVSIKEKSSQWFTYSVPEEDDGDEEKEYNFKFTVNSQDSEVWVYTDLEAEAEPEKLTSDSEGGEEDTEEYVLESKVSVSAGQIVYFKVINNSESSLNIKVEISAVNEEGAGN